jgi:hypothetical protein
MGAVGDALHAFLAADPGGEQPRRLAIAARLLAAHRVAGALPAETLLGASDALRAWLTARYPGATWFREWPVRGRLAGEPERLLVGEVDLFLDLGDGFVLVDHESFPGGEGERDRRVAEEWGPQLGWYAKALAQALGRPLKASYIHLPIRERPELLPLGALAFLVGLRRATERDRDGQRGDEAFHRDPPPEQETGFSGGRTSKLRIGSRNEHSAASSSGIRTTRCLLFFVYGRS